MENKEQLISILTKVRDGYVRILQDGQYRPEVHGVHYFDGLCLAITPFARTKEEDHQLTTRIKSYLPVCQRYICPPLMHSLHSIADRVSPRIELIDKIIQSLQ